MDVFRGRYDPGVWGVDDRSVNLWKER